MTKWFLLGAVVGFVLLLFEKFEPGTANVFAATAGVTGAQAPVGCSRCGNQSTEVTAVTSTVADTPPATAGPGGSGFQFLTPVNFVPYQRPGWGVFTGINTQGNIPTTPAPVPAGGGGGSQYYNAAQRLPGAPTVAY